MFGFNNISPQERVDFAKNLAVMLKSGIPINEAMGSLASGVKSEKLRNVLNKVKSEIEMGTSLSRAFAREEKSFGGVFINLIRAGESSGTLDENLSFLADWLERNNDLKKEISAAMLYPKIIFVATFILAGGLAVFILPRIVPLFEQLHVELPLATRILLAFSLFIEKFWFWVALLILGIVVGLVLLIRITAVRRFVHFIYLNAPFLGKLAVDYQLALVSQLFSTLFRSGISIYESLDIVSKAATNIHYQESIEKLKERISRGTALADAMRDYPKLYPPSFVNIVAVGERSGSLGNSFVYLAEFYSKEMSNNAKRLPTVIEPLLLIFIGLIVGFVAISIITPIYELTRGLGQ